MNGTEQPSDLRCVKVSGTNGTASTSPSWDVPLPTNSGAWTIYPDPALRNVTQPVDAQPQRWLSAGATVGDGNADASIAPAGGPRLGQAVFGYATLGGVRSVRSACVTALGVPVVSLAAPTTAPAGGAVPATVAVTVPGGAPTGRVHVLDTAGGSPRELAVTVAVARR